MDIQLIKKSSYDHYLMLLCAKGKHKQDYFNLLKLYLDISSVLGKTGEPTVALMRLNWFERFIDDIFTDEKIHQDHPHLDFVKTVKNHSLEQQLLHSLVKGKDDFIYAVKAKKIEELVAIAKKNNLVFNQLTHKIMQANNTAPTANEAVAINYELIGHLRNLCYYYHTGQDLKLANPPVDFLRLSTKDIINYVAKSIEKVEVKKLVKPEKLQHFIAKHFCKEIIKVEYNMEALQSYKAPSTLLLKAIF